MDQPVQRPEGAAFDPPETPPTTPAWTLTEVWISIHGTDQQGAVAAYGRMTVIDFMPKYTMPPDRARLVAIGVAQTDALASVISGPVPPRLLEVLQNGLMAAYQLGNLRKQKKGLDPLTFEIMPELKKVLDE
jgi:hypothetical protein